MIFDETMTILNKRQMDILIRFWSESKHFVVAKYLVFTFFDRAPANSIVEKLSSFKMIKYKPIYMEKIKWRCKMQNKGCKGIFLFKLSVWHFVHTAFQKGIEAIL